MVLCGLFDSDGAEGGSDATRYLGPKKLLRCALAVLLLRVASFLVAMITIWDSSTFSGGICDFDGELGSFVMAMLTITGIAELDLVVLLIINRTVMPKRGTLLTFAAADDGVAEEATVQKGHIRQVVSYHPMLSLCNVRY